MALAGRNANLKITGTAPVSSTDVACTRSTGPGASTSVTGKVQITNVANRHLDPDSAHSLYRIAAGSTTLVSANDYTLNNVTGTFQWNAGDPSTGTYQADINYLTVSQVSGGREWSVNPQTELFEVTEFGSGGWRQFQPNLTGAGIQIGKYWTDSAFLDRITTDARFVVELIVSDSDGWRYEGFARVAEDSIDTNVGGLVGESVNLVLDGALYFST